MDACSVSKFVQLFHLENFEVMIRMEMVLEAACAFVARHPEQRLSVDQMLQIRRTHGGLFCDDALCNNPQLVCLASPPRSAHSLVADGSLAAGCMHPQLNPEHLVGSCTTGRRLGDARNMNWCRRNLEHWARAAALGLFVHLIVLMWAPRCAYFRACPARQIGGTAAIWL